MAAIASSTTSATLFTAKTSHIIENSDANRLFVLLGSGTASASDYTFSLAQYENARIDGYYGPVVGVWAADGSGHAMVTEISR